MSSSLTQVAVLDNTGTIIALNEAWLRFAAENGAESTPAQIGVGVNYLEVFRRATGELADSAQAALEGLQTVLAGEQSVFTLEYPSSSPTQPRWYLMTATHLPTEAGGAVVALLDITERRWAEAALPRREDEQADFLENAIVPLHWVGPDGMILWANQAELDMLGFTREEYIGHPIAEFHADAGVIDDILYRLARAETLHNYEARLKCKDGSIKHVLISSNVRWEGSEFIHTRCFTRDITERKQMEEELRESEARFRTLANTVPEIVWTAAPDGTITFANDQWFNYVGITPEQNARNWPELVLHPADRERCVTQWAHALETGTEYEIEVRNRRYDGEYRWFLTRAVPARNAEGQVAGWFGTTTDIHARKRTELGERLLAEAGKALASSLDYTVRLSSVAHLAVPDLANWCTIDLFKEDWSVQHVAVAHIDPAKVELAYELRQRYPAQPEELAKVAQPWQHGQAELYPEITDAMLEASAHDAEHYQILRALSLRSAMVVPLVVRDRVQGVMLFAWAESNRRYDEQDLALAEELARRVAIALDNARVYEAEQQARRAAEEAAVRIASLQAVTAALSGAFTPAQASEIIIQYSTSVLEADGGAVMLISQDGTSLEMVQAIGYSEEALEAFRRFPLTAVTPASDAVRTGEPIWLTSQHEFKVRYPHLAPIRPAASLTEGVAVLPLLVENRPLGAIAISFNEVREFTAEDQDFLLTLARQCAQALERARLYQAERQARAEAETAQQSIVLLAEARERNRLAQELHDNVAQVLGYLNLKVNLTHDLLASHQLDQAQANLQELKQIAGETYTDIRGEIFNLRANPSAGINFRDTLRQYIDKYKRFYQLDIELVFEADETIFEFPAEVAVSLIRTLQEALINVRKHAQVNEAVIRLQHVRGLARLRVEDKGRGFELTREDGSSFGLKIMHERMALIGGRLEVESAPGQGTRVTLLYPGEG